MLVGNRVRLRPVEHEDLPRLVTWRNKPAVWRCFFNKFPLSRAGQESWFDQLREDRSRLLFVISLRETEEPIGTIGLSNIDFPNQRAEYGSFLILEDYHGRGLAKESTELILEYAFSRLNMNRIYLRVYANNEPAVGLYESCGFEIEGTLRQAQFDEGGFQDVLIMAQLRDNWE